MPRRTPMLLLREELSLSVLFVVIGISLLSSASLFFFEIDRKKKVPPVATTDC